MFAVNSCEEDAGINKQLLAALADSAKLQTYNNTCGRRFLAALPDSAALKA